MSCVTFAVVQTIEKGQAMLSVLPAHWTTPNGWNHGIPDSESQFKGSDLMYWASSTAEGRLIEDEADKDLSVLPNEHCRAYRCIIKRSNFKNRAEVRFSIRHLVCFIY